jgi:uncharacterized protein (UPF0261 family)
LIWPAMVDLVADLIASQSELTDLHRLERRLLVNAGANLAFTARNQLSCAKVQATQWVTCCGSSIPECRALTTIHSAR